MEKFQQFARPTSYFVLLCLLGLGSYVPASRAAIIGTEAVATANQTQVERTHLKQLLDRDNVKSYLQANGVEPASVQARVDALTDAEVHALATRLNEYPAGEGFGTLLTIAFLAFLTLLITDILGYTDVFPFVKKSAE
jgi:hypothetical protein